MLETTSCPNIYVTRPLNCLLRQQVFDSDVAYPSQVFYEVKLAIVALQSTFRKDKSATINK